MNFQFYTTRDKTRLMENFTIVGHRQKINHHFFEVHVIVKLFSKFSVTTHNIKSTILKVDNVVKNILNIQ